MPESCEPPYTESDPSAYLDTVREYWRNAHDAYLESVGTTFQAGRIETGSLGDPVTPSNLYLASAAGIRTGHCVLDAGCGVCGPAIDIARHIEGIRLVAITISPEQAITAQRLIREAGLCSAIEVGIADFHRLPLAYASFDVVCFFESSGYSYDPKLLFSEVYRVIRPGGRVYIKDVFRKEGPLSAIELADLTEFNRTYAFRAASMGQIAGALSVAGFTGIRCRDVTGLMSTSHNLAAMFELRNGYLQSTRFGEMHFRVYRDRPVFFGEIKAVRPMN